MFLIWQKCFLLPFLITKALVGAFRKRKLEGTFFSSPGGRSWSRVWLPLPGNLGRGRATTQTLPPGRGWVGGMEVSGNGAGPFHLGPLTSTPKESSTSSLPTRVSGVISRVVGNWRAKGIAQRANNALGVEQRPSETSRVKSPENPPKKTGYKWSDLQKWNSIGLG